MTGAMYAAIAGLRTHMQNLNVIGNNVANVNTYGYKSARSVFKTSLYTTLSGGSDGTATNSGVNPSQIGYGATMGSVGIDMSTGNYAVTGRPMDWMLDGDGFFVMGDKSVAGRFTGQAETDKSLLDGMYLTRVGNFEFGPDGYLGKDDDGNCVYGFQCIGVDQKGKPIYSDQLVPIRLPCVEKQADGSVKIVYPGQAATGTGGNGAAQTADKHIKDPTQETTVGGKTVTETLPRARFTGITIDKVTGIITGTSDDTGDLVTIGCIAVGQVVNPNGVTNLGDNYYRAGEGSGGLSISLLGGAAQTLNFNGAGAAGEGKAVYMNQSLLTTTGNGGTGGAVTDKELADIFRLGLGGKTRVLASGLEMSKTDLAQEISQMILTQRGYQANTRIITVTDSMLEELVNMKR